MNRKVTVNQDSDERAIERLLTDYCWANDASDAGRVADTFHVDGVYDSFGEVYEGREAIREVFADRIRARSSQPIANPQHHLSNVRIELDGDVGRARSYYIRVASMLPDSDLRIIAAGWYDDVVRKVDGRWRLQQRTVCQQIPADDH